MKFEWNALRVNDTVLVHDRGSANAAVLPGIVVKIDVKGINGVGVRIKGPDGGESVVWPSYLTVHRDPRDRTEPLCWRCEAGASSR